MKEGKRDEMRSTGPISSLITGNDSHSNSKKKARNFIFQAYQFREKGGLQGPNATFLWPLLKSCFRAERRVWNLTLGR